MLPTYLDDEDVFILSDAEDLVPIAGGSPGIQRYRPRVEASYARIERRADAWFTTSAANVTSRFGATEASRLVHPDDPARVFAWLLDRSDDALGNTIELEYVAEDLAGVPATSCEHHRLAGLSRVTQRYLSTVRYGASAKDPSHYAFTIVFDYGDRDSTGFGRIAGQWSVRADAFSTYRAGFECRTYRRCQRVLVFHDLPELGPTPQLVSSLELTYDDDPSLSHLIAIERRGYAEGAVLGTPPLRLTYATAGAPGPPTRVITASEGDLPEGIEAHDQWVDLDGEGVAGVITKSENALHYRRNLGGGVLDRARTLPLVPTATAQPSKYHLAALGGDGRLMLSSFTGPQPGFHERDGDGWGPLQTFTSAPNLTWDNDELRFIDLDGDGLDDILIIRDETMVWYPSAGRSGYDAPRVLARPRDDDRGPAIAFVTSRYTIAFADLGGDGLRDLVRIDNGSVCYWPNLGHGAFGAKVVMDRPPVFTAPDQFDPKRVTFADIDGSGTSDLLYADGDGVRYWPNLAGNGWGESHAILLPPDHASASVTVADVLGSGTACVVWSSALAGDHGLRYVDLMGGVKPHLLVEIDNSLGTTTRIAYASSTSLYLADRAAGVLWRSTLAFPVHVITRVEVDDSVRRVRFISEYRYRDGYFDSYEREFRGFGFVEQRDSELDPAQLGVGLFADRPPPRNNEYAQPTAITRTTYHTGTWLDDAGGQITIAQDLTPDESRDAYRALRGVILREEKLCDDGPLVDRAFTVVEHSYSVRRLVAMAGSSRGVFQTINLEKLSTHRERSTDEPRREHELSIEVDDLGHVLRMVKIAYPRTDAAADPHQSVQWATLVETTVANEVDRDDWYRHGVPLETRMYELLGLAADRTPLSLADVIATANAATEHAYEAPRGTGPAKRLLGRARCRYFDSDQLPAPLPLGQVDRRALAYDTYGLAFTEGLASALYSGRATPDLLHLSGYQQLPDEPGWWISAGRAVPDPSRFFVPEAYVDPFEHVTTVTYDEHALAIVTVTDPVGNTTTAELDYRVLVPHTVHDANGATTHATFDALGRVTALWKLGAAGEGDPLAGEPTVSFDYAFWTAASPSFAHTRARETHGDPTTRWQDIYEYSDGTGRLVLAKVPAEPARWVGTGRTVVDNKGNPVKQYEPYFSATWGFEDEDELATLGVPALMHYDPLGRLVLLESPDGTIARSEFGAWESRSYDDNDTVLEPGNAWFEHRTTGSPAERRAAELASAHAGTFTTSRLDALGRTYATVADNGGGTTFVTTTTFDVQGNPLAVIDALGRTCMESSFNMIGLACHQRSIDGGERWVLVDANGNPHVQWDGRGHVTTIEYDAARRAIATHVSDPSGATIVAERTVYGETSQLAYARGRIVEHYDGAGVTTTVKFDFKGNVVASERRLVADYTKVPDWSAAPTLSDEVFTSAVDHDAFGRPVRAMAPDGSVVRPTYNIAGLLATVVIRAPGAETDTTVVSAIEYNERGLRTRIAYAETATTTYTYDALSTRLSSLATTRGRDGRRLQELAYTYDAVGNVVEIHDAVQQPIFRDSAVIDGTTQFTFEPTYRLASATGREHPAAFAAPRTDLDLPLSPLPHPNDDDALVGYIETYHYNAVGGLDQIAHGTTRATRWVQPFRFDPGSNRLAQTMVEGDHADDTEWHGRYTYDAHGNATAMPHLARIDWDWKDRMQRTAVGDGTVYFTYDTSGARVRKVYEHGGTIDEHIYFAGYEIYRRRKGSTISLERQTLHVLDGEKRIALVETKTIDTGVAALIPTPILRYQLGNHIGSAVLELDAAGDPISYEEFHPYGTSAYRAQSAIDVSLKRYRYSAKERDEETSLCYYGARYYAPWLAWWTTSDPSGLVDGPNLYGFARQNPICHVDPNGRQSDKIKEILRKGREDKAHRDEVHAANHQEGLTPEQIGDVFQTVDTELEGKFEPVSARDRIDNGEAKRAQIREDWRKNPPLTKDERYQVAKDSFTNAVLDRVQMGLTVSLMPYGLSPLVAPVIGEFRRPEPPSLATNFRERQIQEIYGHMQTTVGVAEAAISVAPIGEIVEAGGLALGKLPTPRLVTFAATAEGTNVARGVISPVGVEFTTATEAWVAEAGGVLQHGPTPPPPTSVLVGKAPWVKGWVGEARSEVEVLEQGGTIVGKHVYVVGPTGQRSTIDLLWVDAQGVLRGTEAKFGEFAELTRPQQIVFPNGGPIDVEVVGVPAEDLGILGQKVRIEVDIQRWFF